MNIELSENFNIKLSDVSFNESGNFKINNIDQIGNKIIIKTEMSCEGIPDCVVNIKPTNGYGEVAFIADITQYSVQCTLAIPKRIFYEALSHGTMILDHHSEDVTIELGEYTLDYKLHNDKELNFTSADSINIKNELYKNYIKNYFYPEYHDDPEIKIMLSVALN